MATIHGLSWFPNVREHFVTWGADIQLFRIGQSKTENPQIWPTMTANLLASDSKYQYVRCVSPSYQEKPLVAAGLANGKVGLFNFDKKNDFNIEFTPRQQRTCLCLSWNEVEKNLLAIGYDRNRSDYCINVWDTEHCAPREACNLIGLSETAHSLCWFKNNKVLISGMGQKNIKIFDLRQSNSCCTTLSARTVYGLNINPSNTYLTCYVESIVGIWDLRKLDKPLSQIQTQKNVKSIAWCPTRNTVISIIQHASPFLNLFESHFNDIEDCCEIFYTKRILAPLHNKLLPTNRSSLLCDVSWHPFDFERVLILSDQGIIHDYKVPTKISISLDTQNNLWHSLGVQMYMTKGSTKLNSQSEFASPLEFSSSQNINDDISELMRQRAINDYGLLSDLKKNGDLTSSTNLKLLWTHLACMNKNDRILGIKMVLGIGNAIENVTKFLSESKIDQWPDFINSSFELTVYRNEQRDLAQSLCGWTFENDLNIFLNKFIPDICNKKEYSRAAMLCIFFLKIKEAIEILSIAADQSSEPSILRMAAIALSGFNADRYSFILKSHKKFAHMQINDPYLRVIFEFLATDSDIFEPILMENGISLGDRLAFACRYLSDLKLEEYIKKMSQICLEKADLNGLLLTGDSSEGVNLLQRYLDYTDDVQTISIIAIRFFHHEIFTESRVQNWISSYRELLDVWGLWDKRSELDIRMETIRPNQKKSKSVFLLCNFCGKSVSSFTQDDSRLRKTSVNINKVSSCSNCRKPLPRCSLCLLHMGISNGHQSQTSIGHANLGWQSKPFSKWFSWCQTCRHGGHTEHLIQWFNKYTECPITGCDCKCFLMDLPVPLLHKDIS